MENFGILTKKYFDEHQNGHVESLDYLFQNTQKQMGKLSVLDGEHKLAFEHLQNLLVELQTKRLRQNARAACKYFTI